MTKPHRGRCSGEHWNSTGPEELKQQAPNLSGKRTKPQRITCVSRNHVFEDEKRLQKAALHPGTVGTDCASRLNKIKFPATFETDAVRPALDRKYAAHLTVTAPKNQSEDPK
jgi:hypothetical protein